VLLTVEQAVKTPPGPIPLTLEQAVTPLLTPVVLGRITPAAGTEARGIFSGAPPEAAVPPGRFDGPGPRAEPRGADAEKTPAAQVAPPPPRAAPTAEEAAEAALLVEEVRAMASGRRRRRRLGVLALGVVACGGLGLFLLGRTRRAAPVVLASPPPAAPPAAASAATNALASALAAPSPTVSTAAPQDAVAADSPEAVFRHCIEEGARATEHGNFALAAVQYRRALGVKPSSLEAKEGLGGAIVNSSGAAGSYSEAIALLGEVLRADAKRPRAWLFLGAAQQFNGQFGPALESYRTYLELAPNDRWAREVRDVVKVLGPEVARRGHAR
jgi:cytochrome c-type biogenesis protein CcmH/NrfG